MMDTMLIPQRFDVDHEGRSCHRPDSWCAYCDEENVRQMGMAAFSTKVRCHKCGLGFIVTTADLGVGEFKANPDTYWFDGSAVAIDKFYVWCIVGCDLIFIPSEDIHPLAQRLAVRDR